MALNESVKKIYLKIVNGRVVQKTTKDDPKAHARTNSKEDVVYERVYTSINGILEDIKFIETADFGRKWVLLMRDGTEHYSIQVQEDSRYGIDLLKKIPNLTKDGNYKITPYDFEQNDKRKCGLSIVNLDLNEKVNTHYQDFTDNGNGTWTVTNLHGFPSFDGDPKDNDDIKVYYMKVAKFLRTNALIFLKTWFSTTGKTSTVNESADGLPF